MNKLKNIIKYLIKNKIIFKIDYFDIENHHYINININEYDIVIYKNYVLHINYEDDKIYDQFENFKEIIDKIK